VWPSLLWWKKFSNFAIPYGCYDDNLGAQGVLASTNFPLDLLPMLEVVQTITEPLLAKLRFHFASGRPTDRIDQPDWLFDTAAKATQENLEAFKVLQPAVEQHGLERVFYLPFKFARAMHAAVQTVLKEHVLPRLAQQVQVHQLACMFVCPVTLWIVPKSYHVATSM